MKIPKITDVVVPATDCPHYLTPQYIYWYRSDVCAKCLVTPHTPNAQTRSGPPRQR